MDEVLGSVFLLAWLERDLLAGRLSLPSSLRSLLLCRLSAGDMSGLLGLLLSLLRPRSMEDLRPRLSSLSVFLTDLDLVLSERYFLFLLLLRERLLLYPSPLLLLGVDPDLLDLVIFSKSEMGRLESSKKFEF